MRRRIPILMALLLLQVVTIPTLAPVNRQLTVVINEICWAGSNINHTFEWIELFNTTNVAIDLDGWAIASSDGAPSIRLSGMLPPHISDESTSGYYLLERGSDESVSSIAADQIYQGALTNLGEVLKLTDADGRIIDTANIVFSEETGRAWPAGSDGSGNPPFASMERIEFISADAPDNWASCVSSLYEDAGQTLCATPKGENSVYNIPPNAELSLSPLVPDPGQSAEFNAEGSDDANDSIESIVWQFGDGYEATGPVVSHVYPDAGQYMVTLLLTDSKGGETRMTQLVDVAFTTPPIADFSIMLKPDQAIARANELLVFQDESSDADSDIVAWAWDFGDGCTAVEQQAIHAYSSYGEYIASLQVTDTQGETGIQTQSISIASQLSVTVLTYSPEFPSEGETVLFDASESFDPDGEIVTYQWDFNGSGEFDLQGTTQTASYVYTSAGQFTPRVTVVDDQYDSASRAASIEINAVPVAQFQVSRFDPNELEAVIFTDLSQDTDGVIAAWLWDFGDGTISDDISPSHVYQQSGTHTVTLTVTDEIGGTATADATLTIGNLPPIAMLTVEASSLPTGSRFAFDASGSHDLSPQGGLTRYEWKLGKQSGFALETSVPNLSHAFTEDGVYLICVRVTDSDGAVAISDPIAVTVTNRLPTISRVTWTPSVPTDADEVVFTVQASDPDGQIAIWSWALDSTVLASSPQLTHTFDDDGAYQLTIQISDDDGGQTSPYAFTVTVDNATPVASFSYSQGLPCDGRSIRFDASSSFDPSPTGKIVHLAWDFGDGTNCPGSAAGCAETNRWAPEHCYSEPGTYIVTLVVIDEHGAMSSTQKNILIDE
ncbi:PKD domain-containing protein [Candidatus Bipolaricaulota bacterium]|nr:PKD domain-containing protein [Candidatus Bipolaricaulota bacterium]